MSASFSIRVMTPADVPAAVRLWNEAFAGTLTPEPMTEEKFSDRLFDDVDFNAASTLVAEQGGALTGLIGCKRAAPLENDMYWYMETPAAINAVCVHPAHRRQGVASALIRQAESINLAAGRTKLLAVGLEGQSFFFPGVDSANAPAVKLFEHLGYRPVRQTNYMEVALAGYTIPAPLQARQRELEGKGLSFVVATAADRELFRRFWSESEWFGQVPRRDAEFEHDPGKIMLAKHEGKVVGVVCGLSVSSDGDASFNIIALPAERRRGGIGSVLMANALVVLRNRGARRNQIWTYEQAAEGFYPKLGYKMLKRWLAYYKPLPFDYASRGWINRWGH